MIVIIWWHVVKHTIKVWVGERATIHFHHNQHLFPLINFAYYFQVINFSLCSALILDFVCLFACKFVNMLPIFCNKEHKPTHYNYWPRPTSIMCYSLVLWGYVIIINKRNNINNKPHIHLLELPEKVGCQGWTRKREGSRVQFFSKHETPNQVRKKIRD